MNIHPADRKTINTEIWWREGTGVGFERSEDGWECVGSTEVEAKGQGSFTEASPDLTDQWLPAVVVLTSGSGALRCLWISAFRCLREAP